MSNPFRKKIIQSEKFEVHKVEQPVPWWDYEAFLKKIAGECTQLAVQGYKIVKIVEAKRGHHEPSYIFTSRIEDVEVDF